jgi:cell filamentation protein
VSGSSEGEVLKNKLDITDIDSINEEEFLGFTNAAQSAIEALDESTLFDIEYLRELHFSALGKIYNFAGNVRTVDMSKEGFMFAAARFLGSSLRTFEENFLHPINSNNWESKEQLIDYLAEMHAELLFIHPFREGNGRISRLFTRLIYLAKTGDEIEVDTLINTDEGLSKYIEGVQQAGREEYDVMKKLFRELNS